CALPCLPVLSCFVVLLFYFFFSSRRRHTRCLSDWSSDVCSSDLGYWSPGGARLETRLELLVSQLAAELSACQWCIDQAGHRWLRSEERRVGKECRSRGSECE